MTEQPYGANETLKVWKQRLGYHYTPKGNCLHWVASRPCNAANCRENHGSRDWMDHVSGWVTGGGGRILICQPYQFSDITSLVDACKRFKLKATIHGTGWYGFGTVTIELRPEDSA